MIVLFNPRATKPRNCRLPLSVLALAAVLEGREEYEIVDGNVEDDPTAHHSSTDRSASSGVAGRHRHARPADGGGHGGQPRNPPPAPRRADRVGRLLPFHLSGCGAECQVRGLRGSRPGRRYAAGVAGCTSRRAQPGDDQGPLVQGHLRASPPQSRTADEGSRRLSLEPVSSRSGREVSAALVLRQAHRGASRQHWMPVPLQFLRSACRLRQSREDWRLPARTAAILSTSRPATAQTRSSSTT